MELKVVVAQKGTREYFLAPRALHRRNCLSQMVVDWYTPFRGFLGSRFKRSSVGTLSRAFSAHSDELPNSLVRRMFFYGVYARFHSKFLKKSPLHTDAIGSDVIFARCVSRMELSKHNIFFGYSYSSLEALVAEKRRGVCTVLDQIDAGIIGRKIIVEEQKKWPEYVLKRTPDYTSIYERNKKEWDNSDIIVVNSEWTKECIVKNGCDPNKIEVLPLAYEKEVACICANKMPPPLNVLWLGRVTLQKGIAYLIEAAKLLKGEPVKFFIAGPLEISGKVIDRSPSNIKWLGNVFGNKKKIAYDSAHVFVLPTLSDGFAITQLEAFAHGLPVVTTRHCGKVVEDGKTGYIVPARDPLALAEAILCFLRDPMLTVKMGPRCRKAVDAYNIDAYADGLINILKSRLE